MKRKYWKTILELPSKVKSLDATVNTGHLCSGPPLPSHQSSSSWWLCAGHWVTVQVLLISISFCFVSYADPPQLPSPSTPGPVTWRVSPSIQFLWIVRLLEVSIKWVGTCHLTKHSHIARLNYHEPQLQYVVDRIL